MQMIPLPSDAVNYDIICSASLYNDLDLLDATLRNHDSSLHDKESHLTSLHDVDDLGLSFDDYSTDDEKRGSYDIGQPGLVDAFFGLGLPDIDGDLFAVSPVEAFGLTVVQETPKGYFGPSASPSYTADHDHCYSIVTKQSDSEKSQSASASSESPSEVSSSEEEVDVITIPAEQKEQFLVAMPSQEAPTRNTRGRRGRARTRQVMAQIALSKSQKVPVQRIQVRGARSNRQKNSPGSSPSCSDDDDSAKRKEHNYSERQRRRDQQNLLQNLRRCIPELENVVKAPKVRILDCAAKHIQQIIQKETSLRTEKAMLEQRRTTLQNKLKKLHARCLKSKKSIKSSQFL